MSKFVLCLNNVKINHLLHVTEKLNKCVFLGINEHVPCRYIYNMSRLGNTITIDMDIYLCVHSRFSYPVVELHTVILMRFYVTHGWAKLQEQQG